MHVAAARWTELVNRLKTNVDDSILALLVTETEMMPFMKAMFEVVPSDIESAQALGLFMSAL